MEKDLKGLIRTPVNELTVGMFVAKLDRPWLETSFALQGFYIRNRAAVDRLAEECRYVFVDPRRFKRDFSDEERPKLRLVTSNDKPKRTGQVHAVPKLRRIIPKAPQRYEDQVDIKDEAAPASTSIDDAIEILEPIVHKLQATGKLELAEIEAAVNPLVSSVLRNKDAVAALLRIRAVDDYTYSHCISNAVWAAVLGRHLGYTPQQINKLALGCALVDIGKVTLPKTLLAKPESPNDAEWALIRAHVAEGLKILESSSITDRDVITMVAMHHERCDGSGYPKGLTGAAIPVYGQIAGIIDTYDAMITERPYAAALSSYDAVYKLYEDADVLFQRELVEQLIQAIGVFPTGTLIELNTGEVGVVSAQNPARRLRPKVTLVLNENKKRRNVPIVTDLNDGEGPSDQPPSVWIARELPRGAFGIDAAEFFR